MLVFQFPRTMAASGRRPDWMCPTCNKLVFGSKDTCRWCATPNPVPRVVTGNSRGPRTTWWCPDCKITMFGCDDQCYRCKRCRVTDREGKRDWYCNECHFVVYGHKDYCSKCKSRRPGAPEAVPAPTTPTPTSNAARTWRCMECGCTANASTDDVCTQCRGKKGFWRCHTCNFDVFASKAACGKCGGKRPIDGAVAATSPDAPAPVAWKCANCNVGQPEANKFCSECGGSRAGAGDGGEAPCVVCQNAPRQALLQHAGDQGHRCVCMDCASALVGMNAPCPICRAAVTGVIRVFDA
jgi:hypothetical protein